MSAEIFTKDNIENYIKQFSKEFRKLNGDKMPAEIVLVGGAAILLKYNFRKSTKDVDAIILTSSVINDAINITGEKYNLPNDWLNSDFKNTNSYSDKLFEISRHYKTFSNVLEVRTIDAEYLIAMKLMSGREYKNDLSDISGILHEHKINNKEIKIEDIKKAASYLYGEWNNIPEKSRNLIETIFNKGDYEKTYNETIDYEEKTKGKLIEFDEKYPDFIKNSNINEILDIINKKDDNAKISL
jgi:predicted nucleotidyltransferase